MPPIESHFGKRNPTMFLSLALVLLSTMPNAAEPAVDNAQAQRSLFVDALHGWAVGDRGAIWHTDDGGQQWQRQSSGLSCPLRAVSFCDEQIGWVAGGWTHPYTLASSGVLLATTDGGQTWTNTPKLTLPSLRRMRFLDPQQGWVLGDRSAMYPSGVFVTEDGGRHWSPLPGGDSAGWSTADFLDVRASARWPAVADGSARSPTAKSKRPAPINSACATWSNCSSCRPATAGYPATAARSVGPVTWAQTWAPPGELPRSMTQFDFLAMAVRGPRCWLAGSPGSRVFHTADAGRTWSSFATGSLAPLHAMTFVDDLHGWAAG